MVMGKSTDEDNGHRAHNVGAQAATAGQVGQGS